MRDLTSLCVCVCALLLLLPAAASAAEEEEEEEEEDVDVLVFAPRNNSFLFSRARVAPAVRYAQRRLEAAGGAAGVRLNVHFEDSDCANQALFALVERSCGRRRPDLILGPVCEYEAAAVVRLASRWGVPVISAGALAAGFGDKRGEYAQLTRIAPSYAKMAETFAALFERFSWRSALLVFEDDKRERNCYFTLEGVYHLMADHHQLRTYPLSDDEDPPGFDDLLNSIHDSEVVIMCMAADKIRELMLAAHRRQLTDGSCMFFSVELFNASSYGNGSWRRGDQHDGDARQAYASLNTVTLLRTLEPDFEDFSIQMTKSAQQSGLGDCQDCGDVNMFVEGFHDAVLLYAIALHEAMKNGLSKRNGTEITARMWNRTFQGIAGPVSMDANGDRNGDFSLMAMTDVEAGTYEAVANYFGANGTFQLLPAFNADRFTLRGRHKALPDPVDKSCGLGVSALTGVIVGAVLGTLMLIAFYFFRKNYRITIERRTRGEECDSGKHRQLREDSIRSNFSAA